MSSSRTEPFSRRHSRRPSFCNCKAAGRTHTSRPGDSHARPSQSFAEDRDRGEGIYKAREVRKKRTTKKPQVIVKYDAAKEHPAQTELYNADVEVGTIEEQEWSGLLTPAEKAAILARIEELTRAVRSARSRANDEQVDKEQRSPTNCSNTFSGSGDRHQPAAVIEA